MAGSPGRRSESNPGQNPGSTPTWIQPQNQTESSQKNTAVILTKVKIQCRSSGIAARQKTLDPGLRRDDGG